MRPKPMIDVMFALMAMLTKVDVRWKSVTPSMMNTNRPRYRSLLGTFKKLEKNFDHGREGKEPQDTVVDEPPAVEMQAKEPPKSILRKRVTFPAPEKETIAIDVDQEANYTANANPEGKKTESPAITDKADAGTHTDDEKPVTFSRKSQTSSDYAADQVSLLTILEANKRKKKMLRKQNVTLKVTIEHIHELVSKKMFLASDSDVEDDSDGDCPQQEQKNNKKKQDP